MTDRTSIYIGQALRRLLAERPEDKGLWTRSGLINTIAARYAECCRRHMPTLTAAEWCACMDALNGVWLQAQASEEAGLLTAVWAEVYDADRLNGLGAKWEIDARALAERVRRNLLGRYNHDYDKGPVRSHGISCPCCRQEGVCNACGTPVERRPWDGRLEPACTNGRCRPCCSRLCRHEVEGQLPRGRW